MRMSIGYIYVPQFGSRLQRMIHNTNSIIVADKLKIINDTCIVFVMKEKREQNKYANGVRDQRVIHQNYKRCFSFVYAYPSKLDNNYLSE